MIPDPRGYCSLLPLYRAFLDDQFQCHAYLIANGEQSVLLDPGSLLTFDHTLKKIESVMPFGKC